MLEQIRSDMKIAMKTGDKIKVETLRMVIAEAQKEQIDRQRPLKDEEVIGVIKKGMKTRLESIEQFEKGGRQDLVEKEKKELEVLKFYLPSQLTGEALKKVVEEVIATLKASSKKDIGLVMKTVMGQYGSQVDGKEVQTLVSLRLNV
jgi:uncharacterized protein YqeY